MRTPVIVLACLIARVPLAEEPPPIERYAVLIGNNAGARDEPALRYAEDDASRLYDVIKELGGFAPENILLLRHENAQTVRRALINVNDRIRARNAQVMLLVYYSGHADGIGLHLGPSTLEIDELEKLVRGSASSFRLLVIDACRSGAVTRVKGGSSAPPIPIALDQRIAGEGAVFLTASAANEDAQESDELKASFFTHYLVSGLLGAADANGDGAVTLEESYRYVYDATLKASTRTLAGPQHPTYRYETRGHGELVLATLGQANRATVYLPAGRTYLIVLHSKQGAVVAEVSAQHHVRRLSLRPDRYFVLARGEDFLLEGNVSLAPDATLVVEDRLLRRIEYAQLVRKGKAPRGLVHGPQVGYFVHTALSNSASPCNGLFVAYPLELSHLSITPQLDYCRADYRNDTLAADDDEFAVALRLSHAWDLPFFTIDLGLGAGAALLRQSFASTGRAPDLLSAALLLSAGVALSHDLPKGFYVLARVDAQTYFYRQTDADGHIAFAPSFAARVSLGVGKRL